eukprot:scaffold482_cov266-Amphora_coffeaeformis.AAC.10
MFRSKSELGSVKAFRSVTARASERRRKSKVDGKFVKQGEFRTNIESINIYTPSHGLSLIDGRDKFFAWRKSSLSQVGIESPNGFSDESRTPIRQGAAKPIGFGWGQRSRRCLRSSRTITTSHGSSCDRRRRRGQGSGPLADGYHLWNDDPTRGGSARIHTQLCRDDTRILVDAHGIAPGDAS